ncbi:Protein SAAL1, partial [Stegodyphus mimosarum]
MSFDSDRNPSPPPEILKNENLVPDRVGKSVYSKQWVYKTLMAVIEVIKSTASDKPGNSDNSAEKNENEIVELDPKIEEDACTLWDMAANPEVAEFLYECGAADIFLDVVDSTKSPRLLEIVIGILGNMTSFDAVCQNLSKNKQVVYSAIMLSGTSDSPTLLQVF